MKTNTKIFNKLRIVWNITNSCPFNCPMCVVSANCRKEKNIDKEKILSSLLTFDNITIDFAGGDPLYLPENIEIIKKASKILGRDNISISGTGLSLLKFTDEELINLSSSYDLTYDFPKKYIEYDIRDKRYNLINYEQCKRLLNLDLQVDIYLPIRNMPKEYFDELAKDLCDINPGSINFLKLMPLNEKYEEDVDSVNLSNYLANQLRKNGYTKKIGINCALKEDYDCKNNCNMLTERKVGLDQYGNLYTCIWASDILIDREINPFYLGNLLDNTLDEILNNENTRNMYESLKNDRDKCYVLHYYNNKKRK